ncbi:MAG: hypothetical protein APF77_06785 [Clostridia bacterium BRH_c25]|nr:MAG: hypothetical protein APF77_06785 [Clostridia bacterium BRH_c25]
MEIKYPQVGICGLSCKLCPMYQTDSKCKCEGCKSEARMSVGCPFITCAIKKKGIEFCWECNESADCPKWKKHRAAGKEVDSFKCYQKLEDDICFVQNNGIEQFVELQNMKEEILKEMLDNFNEGRSKSYYCIATTVMEVKELKDAVVRAKEDSYGLEIKNKSKVLHKILDEIAEKKKYNLRLRK